MTITVLSVTSEAVPLVKTGGLADVAGALPAALAGHGVAMTTLLPGYPAVLERIATRRGRAKKPSLPDPVHAWDSLLGEPARLLPATLDGRPDGPPLLVLDCPALFGRGGGPYADGAGRDWPDNWRRFAALGRAAADVAGGAVAGPDGAPGMPFDVLHAHDWQAGLAPAYLRYAPPPALAESGLAKSGRAVGTVMTIHNMAFQGYYGSDVFPWLGLPAHAWSIHGVEYNGGVGYLKSGMQMADRITTVSPTYAREIRSPEFGMGLHGLVAACGDRVRGLLNGIDTAEWNPAEDSELARRYSPRALAGRHANKRALERDFTLERSEGPIFVVVSRLTWQKGMDVLPEVIDHLVGLGGRLALLGTGDPAIVGELHRAAARHPGRVSLRIGYDERLAHRMQAGGDAILIPSRFEPCGLTQLYGLAYGCVPVVSRTGGLADTVIDANLAAITAGAATGVMFERVDYACLSGAITRVVELYAQGEVWRSLQRAGMRTNHSWTASAAAYADLYRELVPESPDA